MIKIKLRDPISTRILIAQSGKTLSSFSRQIGISPTYLTQILKGNRNPSPTVANKISKGLKADIKDIFIFQKNEI